MWTDSISYQDLALLVLKGFENGSIPFPKEFQNKKESVRACCGQENITVSDLNGIMAKVFFRIGEEVVGTTSFRFAVVPWRNGRQSYPDFHMGYDKPDSKTKEIVEDQY